MAFGLLLGTLPLAGSSLNAAGDAVSVDTTRLVLVVFGVMALLAVAISVFVIIKRKRA